MFVGAATHAAARYLADAYEKLEELRERDKNDARHKARQAHLDERYGSFWKPSEEEEKSENQLSVSRRAIEAALWNIGKFERILDEHIHILGQARRMAKMRADLKLPPESRSPDAITEKEFLDEIDFFLETVSRYTMPEFD